MLRTLDRYVIREILPPFFLSLVVFTFLLEIPPVMRELEGLVAKGVSWQVAARILWTLIPQGLGITIPMALLTGTLIGLGRLSADREGVALLACGVSPYRLLRPVLVLGILGTAATAYVMFKAIPDANQTFREITWEVISKRLETDIRPRVFFEDFPGWVLYSRDEPDPGGGGWKDVLVANTEKADETRLFMAKRGRLVLAREERRVELVLSEGARYSARRDGAVDVYRFEKPGQEVIVELDPETVFRRQEIGKGITEKTLAELRADGDAKLKGGHSPHPEIMYAHQKFSIPVACLVFAVIGLALGLTVARDSKMAGFVVGIAVIFAYYIVMYTAEAHTKGYYRAHQEVGTLQQASFLFAHIARWWPNILLGAFGVAALVWRARFAERRLPVSLPIGLPQLPARWTRSSEARSTGSAPAATAAAPRRKAVVVIRLPRLRIPGAPGILDRYVARLYVRVIALAFAALLGLFYIATFIDRAEKVFKGETSGGTVMMFIAYMTPQYIYYVIPMAALLAVLVTFGLLSRTSELTIMKACGVSLYRIAWPVLALSVVWSVVLFGLEQKVLARANQKAEALDNVIRGRPPKTMDPLLRQWVIGRDGAIYHYTFFDPARTQFNGLSIYRPSGNAWRLASHTFAPQARFENGNWIGLNGWRHEIEGGSVKSARFARENLSLEPPDYFATEQPVTEMMTVPELRRYVAELAESGFNIVPLSVELQRKMAFPFVTIVMTLLAVPFGVTTGRRGTLYGIGVGISIALLYWVSSNVFVAMGRAGVLTPILAAWTPNVIVLGAAAYLMLTAKT